MAGDGGDDTASVLEHLGGSIVRQDMCQEALHQKRKLNGVYVWRGEEGNGCGKPGEGIQSGGEEEGGRGKARESPPAGLALDGMHDMRCNMDAAHSMLFLVVVLPGGCVYRSFTGRRHCAGARREGE